MTRFDAIYTLAVLLGATLLVGGIVELSEPIARAWHRWRGRRAVKKEYRDMEKRLQAVMDARDEERREWMRGW